MCSLKDPISPRLCWFTPLYDLTIHIYLKCCQIQGILEACVSILPLGWNSVSSDINLSTGTRYLWVLLSPSNRCLTSSSWVKQGGSEMKRFFSKNKVITHPLLKAWRCLGASWLGCEWKPIRGRGTSARHKKGRSRKMPVSHSQSSLLAIPLQSYWVVPLQP